MADLSLKNIQFSYWLGGQEYKALDNISLEIKKGEFVGILGPSGSGKTTLLNLLGMIEDLQKGDFTWEGQDLRKITATEKNKIRKFQIGYIFQAFNLFPTLTAFENVEFFLARQGLGLTERRTQVEWALNAVDLWNQKDKRPLEMSGGQRQRVAIARALAKKPQVIIADEPTASLDQATGRKVMEVLKKLNTEMNCTFMVSSHDPMVQDYLKRVIQLKDGKTVGGTHAS